METKQNNEAILETESAAGRTDADKPRKRLPPFIILAAIEKDRRLQHGENHGRRDLAGLLRQGFRQGL